MERDEDQGWEREETAAAGLYSLPAKEDQVFGGEACVQTLFAVSHSLRLQGYHAKSGSADRLYGYAG